MRLIDVFFALSLITSLATAAIAQTNTGQGYYALRSPKWPCNQSLEIFKGVPVIRISYIANTFGNSTNCVSKILQDPRPKEVEVHIANQVCVRNNRCFPYELLYGETIESLKKKLKNRNPNLLNKLIKAAKAECDLWLGKPGVKLFVSPLLEHNVGDLNSVAVEVMRPVCPGAKFVDNPLNLKPKVFNADLLEQHGDKPKLMGPTIINLDGNDALDQSMDLGNYLLKYKQADINFIWVFEYNGNCRKGGPFIDPRKRECYPDNKIFNQMRPTLKPINVTASLPIDSINCAGGVKSGRDGVKKGFTWKQSDGNPGAVVLLPATGKYEKIFAINGGAVIEHGKFAYNYTEDGSNRPVFRFQKPIWEFPYNSVLHADKSCFELDTAKFRID